MKGSYLWHLALVFFLSVLYIPAYSQTMGSVSPDQKMIPGGNASTGLSSIYAPDLFDGSLNFSIPIFQFNDQNGDYGISLTYNTKGVRVDEVDEALANHWNVIGTPSITRVINDLPDELNYVGDSLIPVGGSGSSGFTLNKNRYLKGRFTTYTETPAQQAAPYVYRDGECDDYVLSVGGINLTFKMGKDFKIFSHPHKNIKVTMMVNGVPVYSIPGQSMPQGDISFLVQDEKGNKFTFVKSSSIQFFLQTNTYGWNDILGTIYPTTRWVASKVTLANGSEIRYRYSQENTANYVQYYAHNSNDHEYLGKEASYSSSQYTMLNAIDYPNGATVTFVYDPVINSTGGKRLLNGIRISSGNNCIQYTFEKEEKNYRRFLKKITKSDCDAQVTETYYAFDYNKIGLPPRLHHAQDFFGYYNADSIITPIPSSTSPTPDQLAMTIPKHNTTSSNYGNNRSYNPIYAQAGLLTKVTNATGGTITLRYKGHSAVQTLGSLIPSSDPSFVGRDALDGVCIDSVIEWEPYHPENSQITKFTFSNGQIFMGGGYFHMPIYADSASGNWEKVNYQGMFLSPHQLVNGSNHGYSNVSVRTMTGDGQQLGRIDTRFSNMIDEETGSTRYFKAAGSKDFFQYPYTDKQYLKDWTLGKPLEITEYDKFDFPVSRTRNKYQDKPDTNYAADFTNIKTAKVNSGTFTTVGNTLFVMFPYQKQFTDTYYPFTGEYLLTQTIKEQYTSNSTTMADTVIYTYDSRNNLKSTIAKTSEGDEIHSINYYNYDAGASDPMPGLEKQVSMQRWKRIPGVIGVMPESGLLLEAQFNGYFNGSSNIGTRTLYNALIGKPKTYSDYLGQETDNSIPKKIDAAFHSKPIYGFRLSSEVLLIDPKSNPLETQLFGEEQYKAMIWDTATGQKLAEASNCRFNDIAYTSFETSAFNSNFSFDNQRSGTITFGGVTGRNCYSLWNFQTNTANQVMGTQDLTKGKEYILSFWINGNNPSVVLSNNFSLVIPSMPVSTKGDWRHYILRFTPAAAGKISIIGSSNSSLLDEVRLFPSTASMQSWTFEPLFGQSSQTDGSGRITYSEYDKLGRQTIVRDQENRIQSKVQFTSQGLE